MAGCCCRSCVSPSASWPCLPAFADDRPVVHDLSRGDTDHDRRPARRAGLVCRSQRRPVPLRLVEIRQAGTDGRQDAVGRRIPLRGVPLPGRPHFGRADQTRFVRLATTTASKSLRPPSGHRPDAYFNIEMNVNGAVYDDFHPHGPDSELQPGWNAEGLRIATHVNGTLNNDADQDDSWTSKWPFRSRPTGAPCRTSSQSQATSGG